MGLLTDKLSVHSRGIISLEGVGVLNDYDRIDATVDAVVCDHTSLRGRGCSFRREVALLAQLCISICITVCFKSVLRFTAEWSCHQRVPTSAIGTKNGKESADLQT